MAIMAVALWGAWGPTFALAAGSGPAQAGGDIPPLFMPTGFNWSQQPELAGLVGPDSSSPVGYDYWQFNPQPAKAGPFSARVLAPGQVPGLETLAPLPGEAALETEPPYGGYLALEWRSKSWGLTIGGGYSRSFDLGDQPAGSVAPRRIAASFSGASAAGSTGGRAPLDRWSAFLALPYRISDRLGVRPEVSFSYESPSTGARAPGNEWVMGLQFDFGF